MSEDIRQLSAAFRYGMIQDVVVVDDRLLVAEVRALLDMRDEMMAVGLMKPDGTLSDAYEDARWHAYDVLPTALSEDERIALIVDVHRAAMADGSLDVQEHALVSEAAERLAIPYETLRKHLARL